MCSSDLVTMLEGTSTASNSGNIRVQASTTGNLTVGVIDARSAADRSGNTLTDQGTWGAVSLVSNASILDTTESSVLVDVYAGEFRLNAATGVGASGNHLETEVAKVSAAVNSTGLFILESTAVEVTQTAAIPVNRVASNASTTTVDSTDAIQSDFMITGDLVLQTTAGAITVSEGDTDTGTLGISASGNILLTAGGTSNIKNDADVISTGGHISLNASQDILQNADITAQASGKTIDLLASRHITMAQTTSSTTTNNGDISLVATSGDVTIETLAAGTKNKIGRAHV